MLESPCGVGYAVWPAGIEMNKGSAQYGAAEEETEK